MAYKCLSEYDFRVENSAFEAFSIVQRWFECHFFAFVYFFDGDCIRTVGLAFIERQNDTNTTNSSLLLSSLSMEIGKYTSKENIILHAQSESTSSIQFIPIIWLHNEYTHRVHVLN